jgi:C-terminal processing protease CtpA/Prc
VNDIIVEINGKEVLDCDSFTKTLKGIEEEKSKSIVLKVKRDVYAYFVQILPVWKENNK